MTIRMQDGAGVLYINPREVVRVWERPEGVEVKLRGLPLFTVDTDAARPLLSLLDAWGERLQREAEAAQGW